MENKRALSDVVTTVLIILLALAAIVLVWSFVKPTLQNAGESLSADCIQLQLEPKSCITNSTMDASVVYQWKSGDVELSGVKVIIEDETGASVVADGASPSEVLASGSTSLAYGSDLTGSILKAKVVGVIAKSNGESQTCPADGAQEITCTAA